MKKNTVGTVIAVIIVAALIVVAYKAHVASENPSLPQAVALTMNDNTKTLAVTVGQQFTVTLDSPVDANYQFDRPEYDTSLIHLDSLEHSAVSEAAPGDLGSDIWTFTAVAAGATDLTITESRIDDPSTKMDMFTTALAVQAAPASEEE